MTSQDPGATFRPRPGNMLKSRTTAHRALVTALLWLLISCAAAQPTEPAVSPQAKALMRAAPTANPTAVRLALRAVKCAEHQGEPVARRLALIDYSRPSSQRRLWVFDLQHERLLFREWVAHGRGSGVTRAERFSDQPGSHASSLGLFRTLQTYVGHNGYSLRLQGLEPGINDRAYARNIVIHGAHYVSAAFVRLMGRLGRSFGCPAVREKVARPLINSLADNQYLFAYYPDPRWLDRSRLLSCSAATASE